VQHAKNMVTIIGENSQSIAISMKSIQEDLDEEKIIHQLKDDMEIEQQIFFPVDKEDAYSYHAFEYFFMFFKVIMIIFKKNHS